MIIRYLSRGPGIYRTLTTHSYPISLRRKPVVCVLNGLCAAAPRTQCHSRSRSLHTTTIARRDVPGIWIVRKAINYINNDPLTKISLIFGGGLLTFLLFLEFLTSLKKKKPISTVTRPPKAMHTLIKLSDEIDSIGRAVKALQQQSGLPVLFVTGSPGVGKTHLAYQYTEEFTNRGSFSIWLYGKPAVLYIDGSDEEQMLQSLREAAFSLGAKLVREQDSPAFEGQQSCVAVAEALKSKLSAGKVPWLMVVDNLDERCAAMLDCLQEGLEGTQKGMVLVTARSFFAGKATHRKNIEIQGINDADAVKLIKSLVPNLSGESDTSKVTAELPKSIMAAALAGMTIKLYSLLLEEHGHTNPTVASLDHYLELLREETGEEHTMDRLVALYLEAASSYDQRLKHGFDFIASFGSGSFPIPVSSIEQHLQSPFYALPPPMLNVPPQPLPDVQQSLTNEASVAADKTLVATVTSYFEQFKTLLNFRKDDVLQSNALQSIPDSLGSLRESPLLTFQTRVPGGVETAHVHCVAFPQLCTQFVSQTVPQLERTHLLQAEDHFNKTAWFKTYRSFNSSKALNKYLCSLPGVSSPGVATEEGFKKNGDRFAASLYGNCVGCRPKGSGLTYSEYLHLVSHYHRVTESLNRELKSATGDMEDTRLKVLLKPLFKCVAQYPLLSTTDKLTCQSAVNSINGAITTDYATQLKHFESILKEQKQLCGSKSLSVAQTLAEMADQKYSMQDYSGAKQLLEEALSVLKHLQSTPARRNNHFLDYGLTLSSLGIVCNVMGEHELSKNYLEQALATYQTLPDDGNITKRQRKLIASTLIDLSHVYLTMGQLVLAKKHVELAVDAVKAVYGEKHPELARVLNVKSIAYAMLGDREGSRKLRQEAGTVLERVSSQPA